MTRSLDWLDTTNIELAPDGVFVETDYKGTYADMPTQEELSLIEELEHQPWQQVVYRRYFHASPWLYRIITDQGRAQFLDVIPFRENGRYLDVGSGWGQVSIPLARTGQSIAFDLTKNRLDILQAIAVQEKVDVTRVQGNFLTFPFNNNQFDLIVFNGSLEWIASGRSEKELIRDAQVTALRKAAGMIRGDGYVYIGIENSLGSKYLTGADDDHTGVSHLMYLSERQANEKHAALKGTVLPAKTWSLREYEEMFVEAGLRVEQIYACYPDYKMIRLMVPLEDVNRLFLEDSYSIAEHDGYRGRPLELSAEIQQMYRTLALNGIAHYFCPSFGIVLRKVV